MPIYKNKITPFRESVSYNSEIYKIDRPEPKSSYYISFSLTNYYMTILWFHRALWSALHFSFID